MSKAFDGHEPDVASAKTSLAGVVRRSTIRKRGGESKCSPRRIAAVLKQNEALGFRAIGVSYAQIATACGFNSAQAAYSAIQSALKRTLQDNADNVRRLELERLDALFVKPYSNALNGDTLALTACLNIMQRRARLLGLDAPEKKELTGKDGAPLQSAPTTIIIGGPGEGGEPEITGASVDAEHRVANP